MELYGTQLASEQWFQGRAPRVMSVGDYRGAEEDRPWYRSVGRDRGRAPLWTQQEVRSGGRAGWAGGRWDWQQLLPAGTQPFKPLAQPRLAAVAAAVAAQKQTTLAALPRCLCLRRSGTRPSWTARRGVTGRRRRWTNARPAARRRSGEHKRARRPSACCACLPCFPCCACSWKRVQLRDNRTCRQHLRIACCGGRSTRLSRGVWPCSAGAGRSA